ncbi:prolycopene isomerase, chloroplastic [Iris pallida]|uniref:Prolycopene isomerase, chloroplastic n=1 Tax=Iris pallida TaxID=29817 RepID=A0AAX6FKY4_IRIPA|nr:prolycopene isomerase, chloroplastic [Iris pallida]
MFHGIWICFYFSCLLIIALRCMDCGYLTAGEKIMGSVICYGSQTASGLPVPAANLPSILNLCLKVAMSWNGIHYLHKTIY